LNFRGLRLRLADFRDGAIFVSEKRDPIRHGRAVLREETLRDQHLPPDIAPRRESSADLHKCDDGGWKGSNNMRFFVAVGSFSR
jgi:hypothetical protein